MCRFGVLGEIRVHIGLSHSVFNMTLISVLLPSSLTISQGKKQAWRTVAFVQSQRAGW